MNNKDKVIIFDTTLRDGEQSPGISLNKAEKLEIALALAKMNVDVIEAGFPIASNGDFEAVQNIAKNVEGPTICGLARAVDGDIDRCWEAIKPASKSRIHTFIATSPIHMEHKLKMTEEQVKKRAFDAVSRAKSYTDDVEFSPEDASRTDFEFMIEVLQAAVKAGATTLNIPDTVGYATPFEFADRIETIRKRVSGDYIISTHCHNDLGMAVANSLAGVKGGARQVEVAVNGIGERAGNAALEEIVMAIKMRGESFGNVHTDIDTTHLLQTSRLVSNLTEYPIQYNKAVVGRNAFAHESGIHQDGVIKKRETYEIMDPNLVGQSESKIVMGKHSGRNAFKQALERVSISLEGDDFQQAFDKLKEIADKKIDVTDAEVAAIAHSQLNRDIKPAFTLENLSTSITTGSAPKASVTLSREGESQTAETTGDGMVDAACSAIRQLSGIEVELIEYNVGAITEGIDSLGHVVVHLESEGVRAIGRANSTDVVEASASAYLDAINQLIARR